MIRAERSSTWYFKVLHSIRLMMNSSSEERPRVCVIEAEEGRKERSVGRCSQREEEHEEVFITLLLPAVRVTTIGVHRLSFTTFYQR